MNRQTESVRRPTCIEDQAFASSTPLFQTATFRINESTGEYDYSRSGNPTRCVLEKKIAILEEAEFSLAYSSGMAAIHGVLNLVPSGGKILAATDLYGGSFRLLSRLKKQRGIDVDFIDVTSEESIHEKLNSSIDLLLVESPSNPLQRVADIRRLAKFCHLNECLLVVDNSIMSPWLMTPLALGADVVLESATKFINGHADVTAGIVACNDEKLGALLRSDHNAMGVALGPFDCWLVLRGLETLAVRVEAQQKSAQFLAHKLRSHNLVKEVNFVGFDDHPAFDLHHSQARGPGAVFSFEVANRECAEKVLKETQLFGTTVSFGSTQSTISLPYAMSHASIPKQLAATCAPPESLLRVSIGLENKDELLNDLDEALCPVTKTRGKMVCPSPGGQTHLS